eukprot:gene6704-13588_t
MKFTFYFLGQSVRSKSFANTNSACISFELFDTFGDGWDSVKLEILGKKEIHRTYAPDASHNPRRDVKYCFDPARSKNGDTVLVGVNGVKRRHTWKIYWTATLHSNGLSYLGTFKTFMKFEFHSAQGLYWTELKGSHHILPWKKS